MIKYNYKLLMLIVSTFLLFTSCSSDDNISIVGTWELVNTESLVDVKSVQYGSEEISVYLDFKEDKTLCIYQQLSDGNYRLFKGIWSLKDNLLVGRYVDDSGNSKKFNSDWIVSFSSGQMVLTSADDSGRDYFESRPIPQEVIDNALSWY